MPVLGFENTPKYAQSLPGPAEAVWMEAGSIAYWLSGRGWAIAPPAEESGTLNSMTDPAPGEHWPAVSMQREVSEIMKPVHTPAPVRIRATRESALSTR